MTKLKNSFSYFLFSHPDSTVGFGISPNQSKCFRGLYHRSGITPCPEDILYIYSIPISSICQFYFYFLNEKFFLTYFYFLHIINFSDRKSTRLNSSHANISYAVFCLKKK